MFSSYTEETVQKYDKSNQNYSLRFVFRCNNINTASWIVVALKSNISCIFIINWTNGGLFFLYTFVCAIWEKDT